MSSISKASSSSKNITSCESPEESSWTMYFEDFFNNRNIDDNQKCSMSLLSGVHHGSSSLVSDAASSAAKKIADGEQAAEEFSSVSKNGKRSSFKKSKKIKAAFVDEALEDTASSPVNSPMVFYENQLNKPKQKEEVHLSQEKGNASGQRAESKELGLNGRDSDCTKLKKRGLCLVPLSFVVNYLG